jgi:hypothetical protein
MIELACDAALCVVAVVAKTVPLSAPIHHTGFLLLCHTQSSLNLHASYLDDSFLAFGYHVISCDGCAPWLFHMADVLALSRAQRASGV